MGELIRSAMVLLLTVAAAAVPRPGAHDAAFKKGLALKKAGKFAAAARVFEALIEKDAADEPALEELATLQGWLKRYDAAVGTWEKALVLQPKSPDAHLGLARVSYWKEDLKRASEEARSATRLDGKRADAWLLYGDVLLAQGSTAEARKAYETARDLSPDDPEPGQKLARLPQPK